MCGIVGCVVVNHPSQVRDNFYKLLVASQIRGQDGTGIAFSDHTTRRWNKKASDIPIEEIPGFYEGDIIIGQNRLAIFGLDHKNDQPITDNDFAIVHNGNLLNFEQKFKDLNLKREYEVDTELILRLIESHKDVKQTKSKILNKMMRESLIGIAVQNAEDQLEGDYACLMIDYKDRKLIAFRKYKPLYIYADKDALYWFSTLQMGLKVFQPPVNTFFDPRTGKEQKSIGIWEVPRSQIHIASRGGLYFHDKKPEDDKTLMNVFNSNT